MTACRACHAWLHLACIDAPAWYREHGVRWDALKLRAEAGGKGLDLKLLILDLKAALDSLTGHPGTEPAPSDATAAPEPPQPLG